MDLSTDETVEKKPYVLNRKLFPALIDGKINTIEFLNASRDVVELVDNFGKVFAPLSFDMNGNINKIQKCYNNNPSRSFYIEDMILSKQSDDYSVLVDGLLWLKRALHFMLLFFKSVVEDEEKIESLQDHMTHAYSEALEPHHGWVTKQLFKFFRTMVPKRSILLSTFSEKPLEEEMLLDNLKIYLETLAINLNHISSLYEEHNLDSDQKAP